MTEICLRKQEFLTLSTVKRPCQCLYVRGLNWVNNQSFQRQILKKTENLERLCGELGKSREAWRSKLWGPGACPPPPEIFWKHEAK